MNEALRPERCVLQGEEIPKQPAQTLRSVLYLVPVLHPVALLFCCSLYESISPLQVSTILKVQEARIASRPTSANGKSPSPAARASLYHTELKSRSKGDGHKQRRVLHQASDRRQKLSYAGGKASKVACQIGDSWSLVNSEGGFLNLGVTSKRAPENQHEHRVVQPLQIQNDRPLSTALTRGSGSLDHILTVQSKAQGEAKKSAHNRQHAMTCRSRSGSMSNKPIQRPGTPITGTGKVSYSKPRTSVGHHSSLKQLKESPFGWSYANTELGSKNAKRQNGSQHPSERLLSNTNGPQVLPKSGIWGENSEDEDSLSKSLYADFKDNSSKTPTQSEENCCYSSLSGKVREGRLTASAEHSPTMEKSLCPESISGSYGAEENSMVNILGSICSNHQHKSTSWKANECGNHIGTRKPTK